MQNKIDVVLIDTAGRMQDNEPLMRALSRLVILNQPDLILFIGEALVGNDAVDQLTKFNKALVDLSPKDNIREIDAIILSKFDTVDEKGNLLQSSTSYFNEFMNSWRCVVDDLFDREANSLRGLRTEIHPPQEAQCQDRGAFTPRLVNYECFSEVGCQLQNFFTFLNR
eukprot:TRINITY_DN1363_c0_g1_i3.p1 TRINITY_DN1363_c0_g1~~TRINITY_DN1363_c0_g1_i3.p1  ORF type:complete len:168 (+),score=12.40 TRINITY_DN1363_c0_g1_i3:3-506(+)